MNTHMLNVIILAGLAVMLGMPAVVHAEDGQAAAPAVKTEPPQILNRVDPHFTQQDKILIARGQPLNYVITINNEGEATKVISIDGETKFKVLSDKMGKAIYNWTFEKGKAGTYPLTINLLGGGVALRSTL